MTDKPQQANKQKHIKTANLLSVWNVNDHIWSYISGKLLFAIKIKKTYKQYGSDAIAQ